jgi:hypothetical protein
VPDASVPHLRARLGLSPAVNPYAATHSPLEASLV